MQLSFPKVVDSSMISAYKSCPQKFFLTYMHHWKSKEPSVHLHAGKAFASGIEAARDAFYVQGKPADDAVAIGLIKLLKDYGDFSCPPDSAKSAERMAGALEYYFTNYPLEHDSAIPITLKSGKRGIEFSFIHPLPVNHPDTQEPILYSGRLDAICDYNGGVYVTDEKTTTSLGPTWSRQWDLRAQFTAYAWGCRESGIRVDGCLIRGVSILKTKYDTQQAITYRPQWMVDQWYHGMLKTLEKMKEDWRLYQNKVEESFQHAFDDACTDYGGCGFRQICQTSPENQESWFNQNFERRRWDPIIREEVTV